MIEWKLDPDTTVVAQLDESVDESVVIQESISLYYAMLSVYDSVTPGNPS